MPLAHQTRVLLTMTAQTVLSGIFIAGYFFLLWRFMEGHVKVPPEYKDMFMTLLGVLTAGVGVILAFWFQRQREQTSVQPPQGNP